MNIGKLKFNWFIGAVLILLLIQCPSAQAKIDVVSLPEEGEAILTIYKPANLTLVEERREITLTDGNNRLQFDWSQTKIDPTSVRLRFPNRDDVRVKQLTYPSESNETLIWDIMTESPGKTTVNISYFTLGITWEAYYHATMDASESAMDLTGFVKVNNRSGERFDRAKTRLLMGKVNVLNRLAEVIRQWERKHQGNVTHKSRRPSREKLQLRSRSAIKQADEAPAPDKKEITTEGVSEYYLMSIEGRETLKDGWSKRLEFLRETNLPIKNHYRFWPEQSGQSVRRMIRFTNKQDSGLGEKPLPSGEFQLYKDEEGRTQKLVGTPTLSYLPVGETARVWLDDARNVRVKPRLMDVRSDEFEFDEEGDLSGWNEYKTFQTRVENFRSIPVTVIVHRQFEDRHWSILKNKYDYESIAYNRIKHELRLSPGERLDLRKEIKFPVGTQRE